ncbi:MAG: FAD-dependent oxidoreductase [Cyanobacteria bacterium P01_F01_bin.153]
MTDFSVVPSNSPSFSSASVVVIGAGLTGLVAAQSLRRRGYQVLVLEKSFGVGGRLNTRRVDGARADRGVRYLDGSEPLVWQLIQPLVERGVLQRWAGVGFQYLPAQLKTVDTNDRYCAPEGISQVAKALAQDLDILFNHRAIALTRLPEAPSSSAPHLDGRWTIYCDHPRDGAPRGDNKGIYEQIQASTLVVTMPAPQAEGLLATVDPGHYGNVSKFLEIIAPVRYDPCFSVTATYAPARDLDPPALRNWQGIEVLNDSALAWVAREDRKSPCDRPVVGLQSSAEFARRWVDAQDFYPIGRQLLAQAEQIFNLPFRHPQSFQVHPWRYAQVINPLDDAHLNDAAAGLWIGGDWCGGENVAGALASGLAIADTVDQANGSSGINPSLGELVIPVSTVAP